MTYPYYFAFGNNEKRASLKGRACRILARLTPHTTPAPVPARPAGPPARSCRH